MSLNDSPILYDTKKSSFVGQFQICWRDRDGKVPLEEIGISDQILITGISCVVGDFDGNGYLDFGFPGKKKLGGKERPVIKVLFYHKEKIILSELIQGAGFMLYPARDKKGEFGEPATKTDGLVIWGEGDSTFVYLFDAKLGRFVRTEHASEHE